MLSPAPQYHKHIDEVDDGEIVDVLVLPHHNQQVYEHDHNHYHHDHNHYHNHNDYFIQPKLTFNELK